MTQLEIVVDTRERYRYRFARQQVEVISRALPCGDYGVEIDGQLTAAVERNRSPRLPPGVTAVNEAPGNALS